VIQASDKVTLNCGCTINTAAMGWSALREFEFKEDGATYHRTCGKSTAPRMDTPRRLSCGCTTHQGEAWANGIEVCGDGSLYHVPCGKSMGASVEKLVTRQCATTKLPCGCVVLLAPDLNTNNHLGILDSGLVFCKQCGKTLEQPKKKSAMETIRDAMPVTIGGRR